MDRDAIKIDGNARVASLSVYLSADDMNSRCYRNWGNTDPFTGLAVNVSFSTPGSTYAETISGVETTSGFVRKYQCRSSSGNDYQVAVSVNDESWVGGDSHYSGASSTACNFNLTY